jgi:hypothetical protein
VCIPTVNGSFQQLARSGDVRYSEPLTRHYGKLALVSDVGRNALDLFGDFCSNCGCIHMSTSTFYVVYFSINVVEERPLQI